MSEKSKSNLWIDYFFDTGAAGMSVAASGCYCVCLSKGKSVWCFWLSILCVFK